MVGKWCCNQLEVCEFFQSLYFFLKWSKGKICFYRVRLLEKQHVPAIKVPAKMCHCLTPPVFFKIIIGSWVECVLHTLLLRIKILSNILKKNEILHYCEKNLFFVHLKYFWLWWFLGFCHTFFFGNFGSGLIKNLI